MLRQYFTKLRAQKAAFEAQKAANIATKKRLEAEEALMVYTIYIEDAAPVTKSIRARGKATIYNDGYFSQRSAESRVKSFFTRHSEDVTAKGVTHLGTHYPGHRVRQIEIDSIQITEADHARPPEWPYLD